MPGDTLGPVSASWAAVVAAVKATGAAVRQQRAADEEWAAAAVYAQMLVDAGKQAERESIDVEPNPPSEGGKPS